MSFWDSMTGRGGFYPGVHQGAKLAPSCQLSLPSGEPRETVTQKLHPFHFCASVSEHVNYKMCNRDTVLVPHHIRDVHIVYDHFHAFVFAFALVLTSTWE